MLVLQFTSSSSPDSFVSRKLNSRSTECSSCFFLPAASSLTLSITARTAIGCDDLLLRFCSLSSLAVPSLFRAAAAGCFGGTGEYSWDFWCFTGLLDSFSCEILAKIAAPSDLRASDDFSCSEVLHLRNLLMTASFFLRAAVRSWRA